MLHESAIVLLVAKPNSKQKNVRLKLTTWFEVADLMVRWGCSRDGALERAVSQSYDGALKTAYPKMAEEAEQWSDSVGGLPLSDYGLDPSVAAKQPAPFHPTCKHCGSEFGAWNRNASLCSDCKEARHIGDPRDCVACTAGGAI